MNENLTFNDIVQGASAADWFQQQLENFTPFNVLIGLLAALVAGYIITLVYKKTYQGVLMSSSFCTTLILLCLVTTPVVMCIGSNVALSMGMVGALSIVRFRTAVKDPLDTAYMFWSLTMGIILGANAYVIALTALVGISLIMLLISFARRKDRNTYLLVVHSALEAENMIMDEIARYTKDHHLRSKSVTRNGLEMTVEVHVVGTSNIVSGLLQNRAVYDATMVAYQNETGA